MNVKISAFLSCLLAVSAASAAKTNFDLDWEFALKDFHMSYGKVGLCRPQNSSNDNGTPRVAADTNGWTQVTLPHDWALALPLAEKGSRNGFRAVGKGFPENSVGWYRKRFGIPASADGSRIFLQFDGVYRDATVVDVIALDRDGSEVPDACGPVSFAISGAGRILGVGNGDPTSHEEDVCRDGEWTRRLFNGRCQVVVRAGDAAGEIALEAWISPSTRQSVKVAVR